jgi:hypothetical protein
VLNPGTCTGRVRERVVLMAKDNGWGLGRIMSERKRLDLSGTAETIMLGHSERSEESGIGEILRYAQDDYCERK